MTLPKKRKTPWGNELRSAQGHIEVPADILEQNFGEGTTHKHGGAGAYYSNEIADRYYVASDEVIESTFAEVGVITHKQVPPAQKNLWRLIEGHIGGELTVNQRTDLSRWMSHPHHIAVADELTELRNSSMQTGDKRIRKMTNEIHFQAMLTTLTRLLRSS